MQHLLTNESSQPKDIGLDHLSPKMPLTQRPFIASEHPQIAARLNYLQRERGRVQSPQSLPSQYARIETVSSNAAKKTDKLPGYTVTSPSELETRKPLLTKVKSKRKSSRDKPMLHSQKTNQSADNNFLFQSQSSKFSINSIKTEFDTAKTEVLGTIQEIQNLTEQAPKMGKAKITIDKSLLDKLLY